MTKIAFIWPSSFRGEDLYMQKNGATPNAARYDRSNLLQLIYFKSAKLKLSSLKTLGGVALTNHVPNV
jgi:hypothetical protein